VRNEGKPWSEMNVSDLKNNTKDGALSKCSIGGLEFRWRSTE